MTISEPYKCYFYSTSKNSDSAVQCPLHFSPISGLFFHVRWLNNKPFALMLLNSSFYEVIFFKIFFKALRHGHIRQANVTTQTTSGRPSFLRATHGERNRPRSSRLRRSLLTRAFGKTQDCSQSSHLHLQSLFFKQKFFADLPFLCMGK